MFRHPAQLGALRDVILPQILMDLVRFTLDIDGAIDQIVATADSVFGAKRIAGCATT